MSETVTLQAPLYHHCRPLAASLYGVVTQKRWSGLPMPENLHGDVLWGQPGCHCDWCDWYEQVSFWEPSYAWVEKEVGFFPLFLAVGRSADSQRMSGYQNQWGRILVSSKDETIYRVPGEFPNDVLFSWEARPAEPLHYHDYDLWHCVLNSVASTETDNGRYKKMKKRTKPITAEEFFVKEEYLGQQLERGVWKRSWPESKWLAHERKNSHCVQAVVPELDLRTADLIRCRNQQTRKELISRGFVAEKIRVERWPVDWNYEEEQS